MIVMHFVLLQSLSMDSTAFFYAQVFLYLLMFLEVKKFFSLNLVAGPCDSLNFDKILWHSIDMFYTVLLCVLFTGKMREPLQCVHHQQENCLHWRELVPLPVLKRISWYVTYIPWRSFREILLMMFYMKTKSWMLYFFRSSSTLYMYICNRSNLISG